MHKVPGFNAKFWAITLAFFVTLTGLLNLLPVETYKTESYTEKLYKEFKNKDKTTVYLMLKEFDESSQTLKARVWVEPPPKFGTFLGDTIQTKSLTYVSISASKIDTNHKLSGVYYEKYDFLRGIDIELDTDNYLFESRYSDSWFPFDRYSATLNGKISYCIAQCNLKLPEKIEWENPPVQVVPYTATMAGWSSTLEAGKFKANSKKNSFADGGDFITHFSLYRTPLNIGLTFLISLIFISGGIAMLFLLRSILMSHRPPTLAGLIWAGSTAFTMIQTRGVIPGRPRIGVKYDIFIFYPSLILCVVSAGLMFYQWLSREDWSREL